MLVLMSIAALPVIQTSDLIFQLGWKTDSVNSILGLQTADRTAYLRDLTDTRPRKSILDIDQILRLRAIACIKVMWDITRRVFDKIVFRIESA